MIFLRKTCWGQTSCHISVLVNAFFRDSQHLGADKDEPTSWFGAVFPETETHSELATYAGKPVKIPRTAYFIIQHLANAVMANWFSITCNNTYTVLSQNYRHTCRAQRMSACVFSCHSHDTYFLVLDWRFTYTQTLWHSRWHCKAMQASLTLFIDFSFNFGQNIIGYNTWLFHTAKTGVCF